MRSRPYLVPKHGCVQDMIGRGAGVYLNTARTRDFAEQKRIRRNSDQKPAVNVYSSHNQGKSAPVPKCSVRKTILIHEWNCRPHLNFYEMLEDDTFWLFVHVFVELAVFRVRVSVSLT